MVVKQILDENPLSYFAPVFKCISLLREQKGNLARGLGIHRRCHFCNFF